MDSNRITIVASDTMEIAKHEASSQLKTGPRDYERWEHLHEKVKPVLRAYGTVTWDPDSLPDFYFSGDWFHENSDGYCICLFRPITRDLLRQLPLVLSSHRNDTILELNGIEPPIDGLVIFATSKEVVVSRDGQNRRDCEQRLRTIPSKVPENSPDWSVLLGERNN